MAALTLISILSLSFALPVITRHPNDNGSITVAVGSNVTLSCTANSSGNETLNYRWRRESGSLPNRRRGRNNETLTIFRVAVADSGQYYCEVSDGEDSVSSMRVQVTVKMRPTITDIPTDQQLSIVSGDEKVVLTCEVLNVGNGIIGGYWERVDDGPLPKRNNVSSLVQETSVVTLLHLTIAKARPMHSGKYRCIIYNEVGIDQSNNVTVTITIAPPNITKQPTDITIQALEHATFTCEASGLKVKYEWKHHNSNSTIGNRSNLTISEATSSDEGQYYCVAMTKGGYDFSNNVTLRVDETVNVNIRIRMHPEDVTVSEGGTVVLSIDARGRGSDSFTYEWKKVGSDSLPDTASGEDSTELTITSVTSSDSGLYYCIVMNQWRNAVKSNNATVNVLYIATNPKDTIAGVGRDVTLTCNASGADNLKYQWMRMGNKTIPSTARGVNTSTLIIPNITVDDSGQYKCVVSSGDVDVMSEYGNMSVLTLSLTINNNSNGPVSVVEGSNVTLRCVVTGGGNLNYQWRRVSGSLPSNVRRSNGGQILTIRNIAISDSGEYYCEVDNGGDTVSSMRVQVTIRTVPVITKHPNDNGNITAAEGSDVTLKCTATGDGKLNYQWRRVSGSLPSNSRVRGNGNLDIFNIAVSDSGQYYCEVDNGRDSVSSMRVQVTARSRPSVSGVSDDQELSIVSGNEQVLLTCNVNGDDITGGYWERVNDSLPNRNNMSSLSNNKRTLTITISRARPTHSGTYHCVVYSQWGVAQSSNVQVTITIAPPMITRQPTNQMITALQDVTFTCEAKGFEVKYEWKRHNGSVTGGRQSSLTISRATPLDEDQYYCVAMTGGGYAFSNNVTLRVDVLPPTITKQPIDVTIEALRDATFTCEASGLDVKYEWKRHNGSTINKRRKSSLTISRATPLDEDQYYCVAMTEGGYAFSNNVTLRVNDDISISHHPESVTIAIGNTLILDVTADGPGKDKFTYQWRRRDDNSLPDRASGGMTSSLTITSVTSSDSGSYYCIVMNQWGNMVKSNTATVNVHSLPVISTYPNNNGNLTIAEGSNVTLRCEVTGGGTLIYRWKRASGSLPRNINAKNEQNLTIYNIMVRNSGEYYCEVDNGEKKVSSMSVQVTARRRPSVSGVFDDQVLSIVSDNEEVMLTCNVNGDDITGGYWERMNDDPLPNRNNMSSLSNDKRTLTITFRRARPTHSGRYRCVVYSQWGVAQSRNVQVTITIAPPNITKQPTNVMIGALGNATFTCEAKGFKIKYEWKRHNGSVTGGRQSNTNLIIFGATPLDEDQYYCVAMTEGGYAFSNNVTLRVNDDIRIRMHPEDVTVSEGGTIVLSIDATGSGNLTYEWKKVGSDSLPDTASGGNSTELTITSITSSDSGLYYCIVMNQWGNMVKSNNATVNVLYITTDPKDTIIGVGRNVTLTCNASGADNLKYQWIRMDGESIPLQATGADTNILTIYSVTVSDSGKYMCMVSSDGATIISECGAVSIVELKIIHKSTTFLRLSWSIPTSCHERTFHYTVQVNQLERMIDGTNFNGTYTLDRLRPYTNYSVYVTVGVTDKSQESVRTMTVTSKTLAGEPMVSQPIQENQPEEILNENDYIGTTHKVYLPVVDTSSGPFSHLYIVVIDSNIIINTKRMVIDVKDITTAQLIEESRKTSPSYYVAAVVNSSQYKEGHIMTYILGAGDNTTDADSQVFHNRELTGGDISYFFRVFSVDSSPENEISTTTEPQSIPRAEAVSNGDSGSSAVGPVVGVMVTLLILIAIIVLVILLLLYYKKKYLKSDNEQKSAPVNVNITTLKEKSSEPEKKIEEPPVLLTTQEDEPAIQETSFLESTVVKTSVGQPTTLVIGLPDAHMPEVTWKKDAEPVNHPVLPDGSLYIINTDHTDEGEYTVIINRKESTAFENLQLTVVNPQLPNVDKPEHGVIKVEDFTEHVALLKAEKDAKLNEEFELLDFQAPFTQHAAKLLCNKSKNRYKNIIPYDHSRVVLDLQDQLTGTDYINASHVDGYGETRAYIAAQGPMKNTVDDFWRMIWEQNVVTIVMLTRIVEDAKSKCHQYWPTKGSSVCGNIKVTLHKEEKLTNYCICQFFVEQVSGAKNDIRLIYHFHFTAWPDHGVPKYATALLEFHKKVDKQHKRKNNKPMMVHCSAGVGRTGTFIAVDMEIQHMKKQNVLDVYDSVRKMRFWRNYMVQTISQYTFIHNALLEHIACGDTSIAAPISNVEEKIDELSKSNTETNKTGFQLQFEKLVRNSPKQTDFMYVAAVSPKNKNKNRCQKLLPPDTARVIIPQLDGNTDYINFCFIDDYRQSKAFLAGPGPMQSTATDFWTMIWEKKSHAIVMLGQPKENGEEVCFKYWPNENKTAEFGKFLVETISEDAWDKDIVKRIFKLTNTKMEDDARAVTQLQYVEWSQNTCPNSPALVVDMIEVLERVQRKTGNGPITVHCSDGVGRSGTFCALMVSINRFKAEQMVDVFRTIITMRAQRPGLVANADQFEFIHQGLITMIKRFSPYSNFTDGTAV